MKDVIRISANIASATKNVTDAMIKCVHGVFTMMVLNAYIVAYYTVTSATRLVTGGQSVFAKNAMYWAVMIVDCGGVKKGEVTAMAVSKLYHKIHWLRNSKYSKKE